ncbi:MAG: glycosyltransferase family 2 protein [Gemmatimonadaceae bacterium]|nr:glycosyltransferase family 2 protein [Gemmatimonadaceae bacterium]
MSESDLQPAVSVLVTVFNREAYLHQCLESVLASTLDDFEIIIVDDGSTDASLSIAQRHASADRRVRVYRNDRNLGDYPNRTRAANLAKGRFLKYVDSDDLIYSHSLAIMVEAMNANPDAALGLSHSLPEVEQPYPWKLAPAQAWRKEFLADGCLGSGPSGAIIRRDAFFEVGGFGDWGILSDTDLWYRMAARWPVILLPPGLVWWRRHDGQEFTRDSADAVYIERGFNLAMKSLSSSECPLTGSERALAVDRARQRHARRLISLALRRRRPGLALRLLSRSGLSGRQMLHGLKRYT